MGRLRPLPCEGGIIFSTTKQDGKLTALVTVGIMASKMHRTWGLKHIGLLYIKKCDFIVEMVGNFNHYSSTVLVRFISNQQKKKFKTELYTSNDTEIVIMSLLEVFYTFFKKKIPYTYITCFMWISCKKKTPINYIKIVSKQ